ncbi:MAG: entericidin A/B family lipoprotein [Alphaproteobacteria bacterium]
MTSPRRTRLLALLSVALLLAGLTACNTIEGAGEDVEAAGDAVQDTAE